MVLVRRIKLLWRNKEEGEEEEEEEGKSFGIQFEIISAIRCLWGKLRGSSALSKGGFQPCIQFSFRTWFCFQKKTRKAVVCCVLRSIRKWKNLLQLPSAVIPFNYITEVHGSTFTSYSFHITKPPCARDSPWIFILMHNRHACRDLVFSTCLYNVDISLIFLVSLTEFLSL